MTYLLTSSVVAISILFVGGCAYESQESPIVAVRTDGKPIRGNAVLTHDFGIDDTICRADAQKANLSGTTYSRGIIAGAIAQDPVGRANSAVSSPRLAAGSPAIYGDSRMRIGPKIR